MVTAITMTPPQTIKGAKKKWRLVANADAETARHHYIIGWIEMDKTILGKKEPFQFYDHVNVLIKPTDGCNLRCKYCFHQDMGYSVKKLEESTLEQFCRITFPHYKSISIVWHGGEPTFVGSKPFERYVDIVNQYAAKTGLHLTQIMQTNGTLLTESFAHIIKTHNIGIGISYDGPINDITRGSTAKFLKTNHELKQNLIPFGTIAVVSGANVHSLPQLYEHMCSLGRPVQLNHYVNTAENAPKELNMSAQEYIEAMQELFDIWISDENCCIEVDPFARLIRDIYHGRSNLCARSSCMRNWFCLEASGELTPCDRDFPKEYHYGHVFDYNDIRDIYSSDGFLRLMQAAILRREKCHSTCDVYSLCEGGCNNNALFETGLENNGGSSCIINKAIIKYVKNWIMDNDPYHNPDNIINPVVKRLVSQLVNEQ